MKNAAIAERMAVYEGFTLKYLREDDEWWEQQLFTTSLYGLDARRETGAVLTRVKGDLLFTWDEGKRIKAWFDARGEVIQKVVEDQDGGRRLYLLGDAAGMLAMFIDPGYARWIFRRAYEQNPAETRRRALNVLGQPDVGAPAPPGDGGGITLEIIRRNEDRERAAAHEWTTEQTLARILGIVRHIDGTVDAIREQLKKTQPDEGSELHEVVLQQRTMTQLLHTITQGQVGLLDRFMLIAPALRDAFGEQGAKMAALILLLIARGEHPTQGEQQRFDL